MEEGSDFLQIMLQSSFCTVSSSVKFVAVDIEIENLNLKVFLILELAVIGI
jgi:hypothetical protein